MTDALCKQTTPLASDASAPAARLGWIAKRCVRSAPNHLDCTRCVDTCPKQALQFLTESGVPTIAVTDVTRMHSDRYTIN